MANAYYDPGVARAEKVHGLFARIARRYDLINDVQSLGLHRLWKARVVEVAGVRPGNAALDVCCGTGDLALALAAAGADVTGLDFSEEMLGVARARLQRKRASTRVELICGDAQKLPFADNTFDAVTIGYGLRNLADWRRGLAEMHRVVRPGGRVVVLDFGKPENAAWRAVYYSYLRFFVPVLGLVAAGSASAYSYILESLHHYPAQHGVAEAMRAMRMTGVEIVPLLGGAMTINLGAKV